MLYTNALKGKFIEVQADTFHLILIPKSIKKIASVGEKVNDVYVVTPSKCNFEWHLQIISHEYFFFSLLSHHTQCLLCSEHSRYNGDV